MTDEMPNWTEAPEKLKQRSFRFFDKTAKKLAKGKDKRETIDWGAVSEETAPGGRKRATISHDSITPGYREAFAKGPARVPMKTGI